ncbi:hypothetical protein HOC06_01805 [Candidatus Woesearchaeota archaeon]|nr:hypothetical protein [archaeon]MBT4630934.1 hypothetical protein [Candidatus Woesearchaeota archaeon]
MNKVGWILILIFFYFVGALVYFFLEFMGKK